MNSLNPNPIHAKRILDKRTKPLFLHIKKSFDIDEDSGATIMKVDCFLAYKHPLKRLNRAEPEYAGEFRQNTEATEFRFLIRKPEDQDSQYVQNIQKSAQAERNRKEYLAELSSQKFKAKVRWIRRDSAI